MIADAKKAPDLAHKLIDNICATITIWAVLSAIGSFIGMTITLYYIIPAQVANLDRRMTEQFDITGQRTAHLEYRMVHLEQHLGQRMDHLGQRMDHLERQVDHLERQVDIGFTLMQTGLNQAIQRMDTFITSHIQPNAGHDAHVSQDEKGTYEVNPSGDVRVVNETV